MLEYLKSFTKMLAITFFGLVLRLLFLGSKPFWFDEAISWAFGRQKISTLLTATLYDNHPPLYYLLLHYWMKLGESESFLRIPSVIFGSISIFLAFLVIKELFSQKVALITSLIFAVSPLQIYFSQEARMYSLWIILTLTTVWLFLQILKKPSLTKFLFFILFNLLSLYTYYFALFSFLVFNLFLFLNYKKYRPFIQKWILSQIIIIACFLPWLGKFLTTPHPPSFSISPFLGLPATFVSFSVGGVGITSLKTFFAPQTPLEIKTLFFLLSFILIFLFLKGFLFQVKQGKIFSFSFLFLFLPITATFIISLFKPLYFPRSFIAFSFIFYSLASLSLTKMDLKSRFPLLGAILLLSLVTVFIQSQNPLFAGEPLREAAKYLSTHCQEKDIIGHTGIYTYYPFLYYHQNLLNEAVVLPTGLTSQTMEKIGKSPINIQDLSAGKTRLWLIHIQNKAPDIKPVVLFLQNRFSLIDSQMIGSIEIYLYETKQTKKK